MNPSDVMLRSDTNWTRSSFPLVTMALWGRRKVTTPAPAGEATQIIATVPRCPVTTELPNPPGVIGLSAVEQRDVIVSAVSVRLQVQLLKLHLDHLGNKWSLRRKNQNKHFGVNAAKTNFASWFLPRVCVAAGDGPDF